MPPLKMNDQWPAWNGRSLVLYHGTTLASATDILRDRVDLSKSRKNKDFGVGFYTTTWLEQAWLFADMVVDREGGTGKPQVIRFDLDRAALSGLRSIAFVRGELDALDFWSFVSSCRNGGTHLQHSPLYYDVAYGPVASSWRGPSNSGVWPGYDQVSFHTPEAVAELNVTRSGLEKP